MSIGPTAHAVGYLLSPLRGSLVCTLPGINATISRSSDITLADKPLVVAGESFEETPMTTGHTQSSLDRKHAARIGAAMFVLANNCDSDTGRSPVRYYTADMIGAAPCYI